MSVIQTLRDKYATVVVIVVCISLVAFLLMDAFVGPKSFFRNDTEVVHVNGEGIQYQDFMNQVQNAENMYRASNPDAKMSEQVRHQIRDQIYNKYVNEQILGQEYDALGIGFSSEELRDLTLTMDAAPEIKRIPGFKNPKTGLFDPNRVASFIQSIRNAPDNNQQAQLQRAQWMQLEEYLEESTRMNKFTSLISKGLYIPKWLANEKVKENNSFSNIKFVAASYTDVSDSSIKVTNEELQDYLNSHSKQYQVESSRSIEYVSFKTIPSAQDSAQILGSLKDLKKEFDTIGIDAVSGFLGRNSDRSFLNRYIPQSMIQSSKKSELLQLKPGQVIGPYFDNGKVMYAKMIGTKEVSDSVDIQQLLISNQRVPDSTAKRRIDSIQNAVKNGANFAAMVAMYSDAQRQGGGSLTLTPDNPNIPESFIHFVNDHKVGDVDHVKTQYGYSLIKINAKKNNEKGYKIAYLSAAMDPSQKTDNAIFSDANRFRGLNQNRKQFEESAKKDGHSLEVAKDLKSSDYNVNDIQSARDVIRWAFKADVNDISKVFSLGENYVIAVLTGKSEKGTATLASVRPQIEAVVRRQKKAKQIASKMKGNSLQSIASAMKDSVSIGQHISFVTPFVPNSGFEPKVVGASFDNAWKNGKISKPIYGNNGVYVLTIDSLSHQAVDSASTLQIRRQAEMNMQRQVSAQVVDVLKKEADIEDRRIQFF